MTNPQMGPNDPYGQQPGGPYGQNPYAQNPYGYAEGPAGRPRPSVGFGEAVRLFFKNYAVFNGRASRSEFWWVILFTWLIDVAINGIARTTGDSASMALSAVSGLWSLAILVPSLAITWRRLHDTGRAGGWWFLIFLPVVGWIILIVFLAGASNPDAWQRFDNGKLPAES